MRYILILVPFLLAWQPYIQDKDDREAQERQRQERIQNDRLRQLEQQEQRRRHRQREEQINRELKGCVWNNTCR